jgi:RNA polymerase sigma-70 factor (ECF subfamily)
VGSAESDEHAPSARFLTTRWNLVLDAAGTGATEDALEQLCRIYWYPLYVYVRRRGHDPHAAEDLTQEFFARLLERRWLQGIQPEGGRFRSFLLTMLNRFLANEWDRSQALKRGGGHVLVSLDDLSPENRYGREPTTQETPELAFDRAWAVTMLDQALAALRRDADAERRSSQFELLHPFLSREAIEGEYDRVAAQLGVSAGAVAVAVYRLRRRYREQVRQEVLETLADPGMLDEELGHLSAALRS